MTGASPDGDRAGHEPSPDGLGHSVAIPSAITCRHCGHTEKIVADKASLAFMTDVHTFKRVPPGMPEDVVEWMVQGVIDDNGPGIGLRYGMLAPVKVMAGSRQLRVVGPAVHPETASPVHIAKLREDGERWIAAMYADPDIPRLLAAQAIEARRAEPQ